MLWSRNKTSKRKLSSSQATINTKPQPQGEKGKKWDRLKEAEAKLIEKAKTYYRPLDDSNTTISITPIDTPIPYTVLPIHEKKKLQKQGQNLYLHSVCAKVVHVKEDTDIDDNDDDDSTPYKYLKKRSETLNTSDSSDEDNLPPPLVEEEEEQETTTAKPTSTTSQEQPQQAAQVPLVLLHGYMNGSLYFYRNIANLANHYSKVYSLDLLGCGLSSRRPKLLTKDVPMVTTQATESLFVEAIEAWRKHMGIPKMVLGGHSLGGYFAVAYCEKYPQHVQQLQLYSPAGIAHPEWDRIDAYIRELPFQSRMKTKVARFLFEQGLTPGKVIRASPRKGKKMVHDYMKRRIPALPTEEQTALADYFYRMAGLKGTGEYVIQQLLTFSSNAKVPLVDRIPNLQIQSVGFLYGVSDWMGTDEGVEVMEKCRATLQQQQQQGGGGNPPPTVDVFEVMDAGHLLMLDEWKGFHGGVLALQQQLSAASTVSETGDNSDNHLSSQWEELFPKPVRKLRQKHKIRPLYFEKVDHDYEQNAAKAAASAALENGDFPDSAAGSLKKFW